MPRININEIDNTLYSIDELRNDNIVYVPGNMPTGEYDHPVLITTLEQFENEFGNYSGDSQRTYDYVKGLLLAGLPVLFRRIVAIGQDKAETPEMKIKQASYTFQTVKNTTTNFEITNPGTGYAVNDKIETTQTGIFVEVTQVGTGGEIEEVVESTETAASTSGTNAVITYNVVTEYEDQFTVLEKYGGSWGNKLYVSIEQIADTFYIVIKNNRKELERIEVGRQVVGESIEEFNAKIYEFLKDHGDKFKTIIIANLIEDKTKFELPLQENRKLSGGEDISIEDVKLAIPETYDFISDKYIYDVKFVTAGGYTDKNLVETPIATAEKELCEKRLDCFAILDIPYSTLAREAIKYYTNIDSSYCAAFAPWCYIKLPSGECDWMAPSYMFLYTLGRSIQDGNPVYSAPAGVLKASMPQVIKPEYEIGGDLLDLWQGANPQAINPLMRLRNYGYVIYGQKTLYNIQNKNDAKASALQEINVRLAINEIRRILFNAAIRLTFQANNQRTWNEFKALVEPKLQSMVSNGGITDFIVKMDNTTTTDEDLQDNTIRARVSVSVTKAVENFEIDFYIEPQSISFAEEENQKNVLIGGLYQ